MKVAIASAALAAILDHAAAASPDEACGIVVGHGDRVTAAVPAANVAARPAAAFEIDPAVLLRVHRDSRTNDEAVLGWYHSHPNGVDEPSAIDARGAVEDDKWWLIAAAGRVSAWYTTADGTVHGRFDRADLVPC